MLILHRSIKLQLDSSPNSPPVSLNNPYNFFLWFVCDNFFYSSFRIERMSWLNQLPGCPNTQVFVRNC